MKNVHAIAPKRLATLLFAGSLAPITAMAGDGVYIGLEGGFNRLDGQTARQDGSANGTPDFSTKFDYGPVGGLITGYSFASGFRPELEVSYRRNDPRKFSAPFLNGDGIQGAAGHNDAYTVFNNLWYDTKSDHGLFKYLHPYFGLGVGVARLAVRDNRYAGAPGSSIEHSGYDTVIAYQVGSGLALDLTPRLTVSGDYRYLLTNHDKNSVVEVQNGVTTRDTVYSRYRAQTVVLNVRYSFGAAPLPPKEYVAAVEPPVEVVPPIERAPVPAPRTILLRTINFEFDRDVLTAPAMATLDEVAAALKSEPGLAVQIVGSTDSVGTDAYNVALSQRRANAVQTYLVAHGVDAATLQTKGLGDTQPIASNKTVDGRTENRRTEFVVSTTPADAKVVIEPSTQESKDAARPTTR